jgi:hypothetical protein
MARDNHFYVYVPVTNLPNGDAVVTPSVIVTKHGGNKVHVHNLTGRGTREVKVRVNHGGKLDQSGGGEEFEVDAKATGSLDVRSQHDIAGTQFLLDFEEVVSATQTKRIGTVMAVANDPEIIIT